MKIVLFIFLTIIFFSSCKERITIVTSEETDTVVAIAAKELSKYLTEIYPDYKFPVTEKSNGGKTIYLKLVDNSADVPDNKEGYLIKTDGDNAYILSKGSTGLIYGVYGILEKLGCGFYLSYEVVPSGNNKPFSFDGWNLHDKPLVKDRVVFNWHNFLSGCTAWNLEDWKKWINNSQKMGFNTIMVHAYGNNPMFTFSFNGVSKPVGTLITTGYSKGWGTQTMNDVRRMVGGELFDGPVFGSDAAMVPHDKRIESAQNLMKKVFQHAENRGMKVCFAFDIGTEWANPKNILKTMKPATLINGKLPNPDTEEGYGYYKAQMESLFSTYPQINTFAFWMRVGREMAKIPLKDLPPAWQEEYQSAVKANPEIEKMDEVISVLIYSKMARAYHRAMNELGHADARMIVGSWRFYWWPAGNVFFPKDIPLMALDADIKGNKSQFETEERRKIIHELAGDREVIPVAWAHHDDTHQIGRSYTPHVNFHDKLSGASGFGIIHWMMHPLDLYFKSLSKQTWTGTKNQKLEETIKDNTVRVYGHAAAEPMAVYLNDRLHNGPMFGRETGSQLMSGAVKNVNKTIDGCEKRLKILDRASQALLTPMAQRRLQYYREMERFFIMFYREQDRMQKMGAFFRNRQLNKVKEMLPLSHPEEVVKQYVRAITSIDADRGEIGYLFTFTAEWLPFFVSLKQAVGMEPVRVNFMPENWDYLAQGAGQFAWYLSRKGEYWRGYGYKTSRALEFAIPETAKPVVADGMPTEYQEICRNGVKSNNAFSFHLKPITYDAYIPGCVSIAKPRTLPAGSYRVRLLFLEPSATAEKEREFDVEIVALKEDESGVVAQAKDSIDIFRQSGGRFRVMERTYPVQLNDNSFIKVTLKPRKGEALICGAILEPKQISFNSL